MGRFAFGIILTPVLVLLIATFLVNTGVNSGLQTGVPYNGIVTLANPGNQEFFGSNVSVPAFGNETTLGCQVNNSTRCNFQNITFLSPNAIPTCIIQLSFTCFLNSLVGLTGLQPAAFTSFSGNNYGPIFGVCINVNGTHPDIGAPGNDNFVMECNQDYANSTAYKFHISEAYTNSSTVRNVYNCTNWDDFANYGLTPWAYWGCVFIPNPQFNGTIFGTSFPETPGTQNTTYGFIFALNGTVAANWVPATTGPGPVVHAVDAQGYLLPLNDNGSARNARACIAQSIVPNESPNCQGWLAADQSTNAQNAGGRGFGLSLALGFIGSILLILIGLGLGIGAGGLTFNFSLQANTQGTRFAQTLGFALLLWTSALSESLPLLVLLGLGLAATLIGLLTFILLVGVFTQTLNVF